MISFHYIYIDFFISLCLICLKFCSYVLVYTENKPVFLIHYFQTFQFYLALKIDPSQLLNEYCWKKNFARFQKNK